MKLNDVRRFSAYVSTIYLGEYITLISIPISLNGNARWRAWSELTCHCPMEMSLILMKNITLIKGNTPLHGKMKYSICCYIIFRFLCHVIPTWDSKNALPLSYPFRTLPCCVATWAWMIGKFPNVCFHHSGFFEIAFFAQSGYFLSDVNIITDYLTLYLFCRICSTYNNGGSRISRVGGVVTGKTYPPGKTYLGYVLP